MKADNFTAKVTLITAEFLLGVIAPAWWIITYFMITGTLHGEATASICIPIGIAMLAVAITITFFLIRFHKKVFAKKLFVFLSSFIPFAIGVLLFLVCAFIGVK